VKQLFLKGKSSSILLLLKDSEQEWYPSKLARVCGASYLHTVNLLAALKKAGAATSEKKGKQNVFKLTEKGAYLALTLDDFVKKCDALELDTKQKLQQVQQAADEKMLAANAPKTAEAPQQKPADKPQEKK
jgi:predicted transcriptional regulator